MHFYYHTRPCPWELREALDKIEATPQEVQKLAQRNPHEVAEKPRPCRQLQALPTYRYAANPNRGLKLNLGAVPDKALARVVRKHVCP